MLVKMRNASQSWVAKFVAGVIIVVLTLFGFGAFNLFAVSEPAIATVNGEDITERRLSVEIENTKRRLREAYGDGVTEEQLDQFVDEEFTLRNLIDTELFMQAGRNLDLTISDLQFERIIQEDPTFQTDGQFDETLFRDTLARSGMSVQTLRGLQQDSNVRSQLVSIIEDTAFATDAEMRVSATFDRQTRDISILEFPLEQFQDPESISEEDIAEHYELFSDEYMTEGTFDFEFVELSRDQFLQESELTEEELQDLHEADMVARNSAAQRRGRHLLVKVDDVRSDEDALALITEIRKMVDDGESLADLASTLSEDAGSKDDGGDLGFSDREQWVKEFSDSLWSLEVGEISAPVKTTFGYHLIELIEVEEIELPSFEDNRDALVEEHRTGMASAALKEAFTEVDKLAFEQSDSLQAIVDEFDSPIHQLSNVERTSNEDVFTNASVRNAFFEADVIENGFNSRVVEVGEESIVVGRLLSRTEPTLKSLEEVSEQIKNKLALEEATAARDAKRDEIFAQLKDDRNYVAASLAAGSEWVVYEAKKRDDFDVDPAALAVAFEQALPEDGERVITTAESEFTATVFIVTVTRQDLAVYEVLPTEEQTELATDSETSAKTRAMASFISSLRSEASVKTELFSYE